MLSVDEHTHFGCVFITRGSCNSFPNMVLYVRYTNRILKLNTKDAFCLWQKRNLHIGIHRVWLQSMVCVVTNGALRFSCVVPLEATHFFFTLARFEVNGIHAFVNSGQEESRNDIEENGGLHSR